MPITLYGIKQNLGICEDFQGVKDLPAIKNFDGEKYKNFKKYNVKGGVEVFRGMADAKLLSSISQEIPNYQRKINEEHREKIKKYLLDSDCDRIYFPEVTLLYKYDDTLDPDSIATSIIELEESKSCSVDLLARLYATGISFLTIQDDIKLDRLDGNHRLTVLNELADGIQLDPLKRRSKSNLRTENRMISYCIILVPSSEELTFEHAYFYLLNSKSLPVTPLQNIKLLMSSAASKLKDFIEQDDFLNIMNKLKRNWEHLIESEQEYLIDIVKELLQCQSETIRNKLKNNTFIRDLEQGIGLYNAHKDLDWCVEKYVTVCCLIRCFVTSSDEAREVLGNFKNWIIKYKHDVTHFSKVQDLYESFVKHQEYISQKKYIFVAMQYETNYVQHYTNAIKDTITLLKGRYPHINIELMPIMNPNDGDNIVNNIMERDIPKCDIFIADFSTNNGNVLLEYGYAKALKKFMCLLYSQSWRNNTILELEEGKSHTSISNLLDDFTKQQFLSCKLEEYEDLKNIWLLIEKKEYEQAKNNILTIKDLCDSEKKTFIELFNDALNKSNTSAIEKYYNDLSLKIFDLRVIKDTAWDSQQKLEELLEQRIERFIITNDLI